MRVSPLTLLLCLSFLLSGCLSNHPLKISDEQWASMTHKEKLSAYAQQGKIDENLSAMRAARALEARARQEREQLSYSESRQMARYGDIIQCVMEPVEVRYFKKWKPSKPVAFDLVKNERKEIRYTDLKGKYSIRGWVMFRRDGQSVVWCKAKTTMGSMRNCTQILGTTKEFHRGIRKQLYVTKHLKSMVR